MVDTESQRNGRGLESSVAVVIRPQAGPATKQLMDFLEWYRDQLSRSISDSMHSVLWARSAHLPAGFVPILHLVALMSLVNADCSLQSSKVHNRCGRNGCPSNVRRGMQCHTCKAWWHFKCTGLQDDQVSQLANSPDPFVCASCLYNKGAMHSQTKKKAIKSKTNSPLPNHTVRCKCSSLIGVLAAKTELFSKALTDANTKNATTWTNVDKERFSLNEHLALSTLGPLAAKKVMQLSDAGIKTATASLTGYARSEASKGLLVTLFPPSAVQKILGRAVRIQKANPTIRRLAEDRPLDARELGPAVLGKRCEKGFRMTPVRPIPNLRPNRFNPRQTTTTPDSSFCSTTADPSNSEDRDAMEEASLTWTERTKYVELSALLSITDVKDKRSQVAKPTGKPTTCADVDIGELCENRTTTEAVKMPISISTSSKVASLIVDTAVAQDHDSQSLKPEHSEPNSPSYTQLATPTAGDSEVHIKAKKGDCSQTVHIQFAKSENCRLASRYSPLRKPASWEHHQKNYSVLPPSAQSLRETPFRSNRANMPEKPNGRKIAP
ncbi:hypothetical protein CLF_108279 [Clonorchis sinensis]|uniref:Zinc finger PHD-type domain-containing protein n=1 Tax=Clonorchis sinensis TaxID=79923 RepID=G7YRG5_CLOSI|nr:hypothetical protein CLF_108279 [Clonorchis sinensis]